MNNNLNSLAQYVNSISQDARDLIAATSDVAEDNVRIARKRLVSAMDSGSKIYDRVRDDARDTARHAGKKVCDNPGISVAIVVAIGALIALLLTRRRD
jgi:ElaB/YqjD/DUF883 family membrane-anchored ribosome-binding protein